MPCLVRLLDLLQHVDGHLLDGHKILGAAALQQVEDLLLRVGQNILQRVLTRVAGVGDLLRGADQLAQHRFLMDDLGVASHIGRGGHHCHNVPDKVQAADLGRHVLLLQAVLKCDQVHRFSLVKQLHHSVEHHAVLVLVKITSHDDFRGGDHRLPVHQHGADNRLLRFNAVRQHPFHQRFIHVSISPVCQASTTLTVSLAVTSL